MGAMVTCPLEVIKTRLQSSGLTLRQVYLSQVQLGTLSGTSMVRPTRVAPGLFQVLRYVYLANYCNTGFINVYANVVDFKLLSSEFEKVS